MQQRCVEGIACGLRAIIIVDVQILCLWGRYVSGDPVHDLASARGHEWLAKCVSVQDVLSQGILSSSTTCSISGCSVEALHVIAIWW